MRLLARARLLVRLLAGKLAAHDLAETALGRAAKLEVLVGFQGALEVLVVRVLAVHSHPPANLAGRPGVVAVGAHLAQTLFEDLGATRGLRRRALLGETHFSDEKV